MYDTVSPGTPWVTGRRWRWMNAVGRLRDGVSMEDAASAVAVIGDRLAKAYPDVNRGRSFAAIPIAQITVDPNQHATVARSGAILYAVVAVVLFIACANLASLLLARAAGRAREIALRTALGASLARILRQLMTESVMLGLAGGAAGLAVAYWLQRWLWLSRPSHFLRAQPDLALDGSVLVLTLALSIGAGVLFGLVPALQASKTDVISTLKQAGRQPASPGRQRVRSALVFAEIAFSVIALVAAGVLIRSLREAQRIDPGFDAPHLLRTNFSLRAAGFSPEQAAAFHDRVVERLNVVPGIRKAAIAYRAPLAGGGNTINVAGQTPPPGALGFLVQMA
jgi:putative ABC transport system permease protein